MFKNKLSSVPAIRHRRAVQNRLLKWFGSKRRDLPWIDHGTPYHIWVSEIMLQQTQIVTVINYYHRFIRKFPNVRRLAAANIESVLKHWEGLGYYRRAKQLHKAATVIVEMHDGEFPSEFDEVLALPGVGRYTAAAILSISKDQPHAILEGNTIRLFSRLVAFREDISKSSNQKQLWKFSEQLVPGNRAGDFNQALMDLGREICKPKQPVCNECPLSSHCLTYVRGLQAEIPVKGKRMQYEDLHEAIVLIKRKGKYLMRKCLPHQRWAGLWDFPRADISGKRPEKAISDSIAAQTGLATTIGSLEKTIKHAVTRFRIRLDCFEANSVSGRLKSRSSFAWKSEQEIADLPMSTTGRKFSDLFCQRD